MSNQKVHFSLAPLNFVFKLVMNFENFSSNIPQFLSLLFWQPLTEGSWAGVVTLTAHMAAKIGIKEYFMDKFLKIHYQLEDKLFR
jgi:hypothetical protein